MNFLQQIWQTPGLKTKILFTIIALFLYRILAQVSVPGIDVEAVRSFFSDDGGGALNIYSMLTGGSMENFSIILMGLAPYINASIIMQLMQVVVPKFEALAKEGPAGQKKLSSYTRYLTVVFALAQSYGMIVYLASAGNIPGLDPTNLVSVLPLMLTVTAGTLLLMWIGELITERGLGNGISLIIFASLVSNIPSVIGNVLGSVEDLAGNSGKLVPFIVFLLVTAVLILLTILATEGQRRIPVNYGTGGNSVASNIPIRILQAGMIPIIFALSLITFPSVALQMFSATDANVVTQFISANLDPSSGTLTFFLAYFCLILFFTFFYVSITFKSEDIAENIQKRGGFVPGYRPGKETAAHLDQTSTRLNLWGGMFLAFVAILPMLFTQFSDSLSSQDLIVSGSGVIIIVGVVLDLIRRINAQLVMHNYDELK